jgi:hypothetical protein
METSQTGIVSIRSGPHGSPGSEPADGPKLRRNQAIFIAIAAFGTVSAVLDTSLAQTWIQTSAPSFDWHAVASSADGAKLAAVARNGPIITSTNSGATWTPSSAPITNWFSIASSADGSKLVAIATIGGTYISADSGATWTAASNAPVPFYLSSVASSADGNKLLVGFYDGVHHGGGMAVSTDGGGTWTNLDLAVVSVTTSANGTKMFAGVGPLGLVNFSSWFATSINSGADWTPTSLSSSFGWNAVASSADGSKLVALNADGSGLVYTSGDSGVHWATNSAPAGSWISVASSADGTKLAAVQGGCFNPGGPGCGGPIYTSNDSGVTWVSNNVPDAFAVAASADGEKLVAVVYGGGIYVAQSSSRPWLSITRSSNNAILSWTVPSREFALQASPDLTSTNWTEVTNAPMLNLSNLQNQVVVPLPGGNQFYRLAR